MQTGARHRPRLTAEGYLALERRAEARSEFYDGEMFAMSGASREHNLIVTNLVAEIRSQLKGRPCELYANDMRVKVSATGLYTYPDVVVVCGEPRFEDDHLDTLLNPTLVLEVLSESTEGDDRGKKFEHYRSLPSLAEYLLVSQTTARVEQFVRQEAGRWLFAECAEPAGTMELPSIGCRLALEEVYDKVTFPPPPEPPPDGLLDAGTDN